MSRTQYAVMRAYLVAGAAHAAAQVCGNASFPSTLPPGPDNVSLVMVGHTGVGKSTFLDLLAGGYYLEAVGAVNGASMTERSCLHHFEYLSGVDPEVPDERWGVLDTPGFADTGGMSHEVSNEKDVQRALRSLGMADAVVLVWKYDDKFTAEFMSAFLFLRANFGPGIWQRLMVVYTFWTWAECIMPSSCHCKTRADLFQAHNQTMDAAFRYISEVLQTGDVRCNSSNSTGNCFPLAGDIPYIGSDLYMPGYKLGCHLLDPDDKCYKMLHCSSDSPNAAEELRRFRTQVWSLKTAEGFQRLDTAKAVNCWVECKLAEEALDQILNGTTTDAAFLRAAEHLRGCFQGGIPSELHGIAQRLVGRLQAQRRLAFAMNATEYLMPEYGFSSDARHTFLQYPDGEAYRTCRHAANMSERNCTVLAELMSRCWQRLKGAMPRPPEVHRAIQDLVAAYGDRANDSRMAIALDMAACGSGFDGCPGMGLVHQAATAEEMENLRRWAGFASRGRCCEQLEGAWTAQPGTCPAGGTWDEARLGCLRACAVSDLPAPPCAAGTGTWSSNGRLGCRLYDALGNQHEVSASLTSWDGSALGEYLQSGARVFLRYAVERLPFFIRTRPEVQQAACQEGRWLLSEAGWAVPRARQFRECHRCYEDQCLYTECIPGNDLYGQQIWLDSEGGVCDEAACGAQRDTICRRHPSCGYRTRSRTCATSSCGFDDCCLVQGACKGVCHCPSSRPLRDQPEFCEGSICRETECCEILEGSCNRDTGVWCNVYECLDAFADCVDTGFPLGDRCLCQEGYCASGGTCYECGVPVLSLAGTQELTVPLRCAVAAAMLLAVLLAGGTAALRRVRLHEGMRPLLET